MFESRWQNLFGSFVILLRLCSHLRLKPVWTTAELDRRSSDHAGGTPHKRNTCAWQGAPKMLLIRIACRECLPAVNVQGVRTARPKCPCHNNCKASTFCLISDMARWGCLVSSGQHFETRLWNGPPVCLWRPAAARCARTLEPSDTNPELAV